MVERRYADAVEALDAFASDEALDARRRALYAVTAGDILLNEQGDVGAASSYYARARALNPAEPRLARIGVTLGTDDSSDERPPSNPPDPKG